MGVGVWAVRRPWAVTLCFSGECHVGNVSDVLDETLLLKRIADHSARG